jgi:hypothetical protein
MGRKSLQKRIGAGELLTVEIASPIVNSLEALPPELFAMLTRTPDQRQEWHNQKHFFSCVADLMRADFLGEPDPDYSGMERDRLKEISSFKWRFVAFYRMVRANWPAVSRALKTMNVRSLPKIEGDEGIQLQIPQAAPENLKTPVALTLEMIRLAAIGKIICAYVPNHMPVMTPRKIDRGITKTRKAREEEATVTAQRNADKIGGEWVDWNEWWDLERQCFEAVKASKPKLEAADTLRSYTESIRLQEAIVKARFHRRLKPKVSVWRDGRAQSHDSI